MVIQQSSLSSSPLYSHDASPLQHYTFPSPTLPPRPITFNPDDNHSPTFSTNTGESSISSSSRGDQNIITPTHEISLQSVAGSGGLQHVDIMGPSLDGKMNGGTEFVRSFGEKGERERERERERDRQDMEGNFHEMRIGMDYTQNIKTTYTPPPPTPPLPSTTLIPASPKQSRSRPRPSTATSQTSLSPSFTDSPPLVDNNNSSPIGTAATKLFRTISPSTEHRPRPSSSSSSGGQGTKQVPMYRKLSSLDPLVGRPDLESASGSGSEIGIANGQQNENGGVVSIRPTTSAENMVKRFREQSGETITITNTITGLPTGLAIGHHGTSTVGDGVGISVTSPSFQDDQRFRTDTMASTTLGSPFIDQGSGSDSGRSRFQTMRQSEEEELVRVDLSSMTSPGMVKSNNKQTQDSERNDRSTKNPPEKISLVQRFASNTNILHISIPKPKIPFSGSSQKKAAITLGREFGNANKDNSSRKRRSSGSINDPSGLGMIPSSYNNNNNNNNNNNKSPNLPSLNQPSSAPPYQTHHPKTYTYPGRVLPEPPTTYLEKLMVTESLHSAGYQRQRTQSERQNHRKARDFLMNESEEQRQRRERETVGVWTAWAVACVAVANAQESTANNHPFLNQPPLRHTRSSGDGMNRSSRDISPHTRGPVRLSTGGYHEMDLNNKPRKSYPSNTLNVVSDDYTFQPALTPTEIASFTPIVGSTERFARPSNSSSMDAPLSNPFLTIRSRTVNATVRGLVVEMIVALAALVDAREAIYGETVPLETVARDLKRNRSSALLAIRAERMENPDSERPTAEDLAFQESEFAALIQDLNECIGRSGQVEKLFSSGSYGLQLAPFKIGNAAGVLRLLIDLEETIWGSAEPLPSDLSGGEFYDGFVDVPFQRDTQGSHSAPLSAASFAARGPVPENNLDDLLDVLDTTPARLSTKSHPLFDPDKVQDLDFAALPQVRTAHVGSLQQQQQDEPDTSSHSNGFPTTSSILAQRRRGTEPAISPRMKDHDTKVFATITENGTEVDPLRELGRARYEAWKRSHQMQPLWEKKMIQ